ncbi:MAG: hypothetical protein K0U98_07020 [Deltaproteobacteria bacterium]|nr:hypothetical protein [Deltaproteobacteria bacterium]
MAQPWLPAVLALLVPGAGHLMLKRWPRGLLFSTLVFSFIFLGVELDGNLQTGFRGPLESLATLASMGIGVAYGILRFLLAYQGDLSAAGFEYGGTFLITAGLMNLLVTLDAWDIAHGRKE